MDDTRHAYSKFRRYAFIGVPPADRKMLQSIFDTQLTDGVAYAAVTDLSQAVFLIVNGDDPRALDVLACEATLPPVLLVGESNWGTGWLTTGRPLTEQRAIRAARDFVARLPAPGTENVGFSSPTLSASTMAPDSDDTDMGDDYQDSDCEGSMVEFTPSELAATDEVVHDHDATAPTMVFTHANTVAFKSDEAENQAAEILIVAEFGVRSHTLPRGLRKLGFAVNVAHGQEHALQMLATQAYKVVFLDQASLSGLLWPLCRKISQKATLSGSVAKVVVVARRTGPLDRWRAKRAGCDSWMLVPLDRQMLKDYLHKHGVQVSVNKPLL